MDITQPDSGQQQTDDVSGGNDVAPGAPPEATGQTPASFGQNQPGPDPEAPPTDRPQRFADVFAEVDAVDQRPLAEHSDVFTRAHRELTDALNDVERGDS